MYPDNPALIALVGEELELKDENGLRTVVTEFFRANPAEFEVGIQLCTDLKTMPVEDASTEWPEDESPYRPVARLVVPPQDAFTPARASFVDEDLSFCPAHSLQAHRPLGSIMRAHVRLRGAGQAAPRGKRPPRSGASEHRGDAGLKNRAEEREAFGRPAPSPQALHPQALRRS